MQTKAQLAAAIIKRLLARMGDDELKAHAPGVYVRRTAGEIDDGQYGDPDQQGKTKDEDGWTFLGSFEKH